MPLRRHVRENLLSFKKMIAQPTAPRRQERQNWWPIKDNYTIDWRNHQSSSSANNGKRIWIWMKKKRVYWVIYHNLDTIIVSESVQVPLKLNIATLIYLVSPKSGTWKKKISEWFSKKCHMQEFCTWNTFTYIRYLEVKCTRGQERQNW